ncbi:uncharacterized protein SAPINGB_P006028 [Magnusiomyces paraingens]|uniref:F-box domain-containing protein n=1 Tax=Magnusiomyces paraingens TaxID=2606893 RepID=A0A5E8C417_9ASCO|nr:uncharacterized protein SAPINGB_P006028 [Saprochaete ingens]VVT58082.1 unnamed protein product [Saprochaete ingens]
MTKNDETIKSSSEFGQHCETLQSEVRFVLEKYTNFIKSYFVKDTLSEVDKNLEHMLTGLSTSWDEMEMLVSSLSKYWHEKKPRKLEPVSNTIKIWNLNNLPVDIHRELSEYLTPQENQIVGQTCQSLQQVYRTLAWNNCILVSEVRDIYVVPKLDIRVSMGRIFVSCVVNELNQLPATVECVVLKVVNSKYDDFNDSDFDEIENENEDDDEVEEENEVEVEVEVEDEVEEVENEEDEEDENDENDENEVIEVVEEGDEHEHEQHVPQLHQQMWKEATKAQPITLTSVTEFRAASHNNEVSAFIGFELKFSQLKTLLISGFKLFPARRYRVGENDMQIEKFKEIGNLYSKEL